MGRWKGGGRVVVGVVHRIRGEGGRRRGIRLLLLVIQEVMLMMMIGDGWGPLGWRR